MDVIRNLSGVQKGLLGGLVLGILVVYLCLCASALGAFRLTPEGAPIESGALAAAVTEAAPVTAGGQEQAAPATATAAPTATPMPTATPLPKVAFVPDDEPAAAPTDVPTVPPTEIAVPPTETPAPEPTPTAVVVRAAALREPASEPEPQRLAMVVQQETAKSAKVVGVKPQTSSPAAADAATPTATSQGGWTWQGLEYERVDGTRSRNVSGVLAVRIVGVPDRMVLIREMSGGWTTTLLTGRKPEYGEFSDDIGGLSPGTYRVKPVDIDAYYDVKLHAGDYVLVEFALRPTAASLEETAAPEPTPVPAVVAAIPDSMAEEADAAEPLPTAVQPVASQPEPTPVLEPAKAGAEGKPWVWRAVEFERIPGGKSGSIITILAVRVVGVPDRKIFVREKTGGYTVEMKTGRKPEYGDFADAVGGLAPSTYEIKVQDIDATYEVELDDGDYILVEFALHPPEGDDEDGEAVAEVAEPAPPPTRAPRPTATSAPQPAAEAVLVDATAEEEAPTPEPAPVEPTAAEPTVAQPEEAGGDEATVPVEEWTWQGIEYQRIPGDRSGSLSTILAVRIVGVPDRRVNVHEATGPFETELVTGRKPEFGSFADAVGGLAPSKYVVKPTDMDAEYTVELKTGDFVLVEFALRPSDATTQ